ncbi:uncharacterized protein LOC125211960 [Salvia hispanica]|uniref:uncharacterized protein LOC125211960 n=1 Tax=Salvia hispanica TaxID=49212 RepID=UPI002009B8BC|nr:uncharacterized protein LOC125211960 [Salvia hispanica]
MRRWTDRSVDSNNPTVLSRIMLRFRPIAPKPAGEDAGSAAPDPAKRDLAGRRVKRKYVRIRKRRCNKSKVPEGGNPPSPPERSAVDDAPPPQKRAVTLQLLGDGSGGGESEMRWRDLDGGGRRKADLSGYGGGSVIATWIVVEGVTVTEKLTELGLGFSDEERIHNLERDTCPGFISDHTNNVIWMNAAYKRMVAADDEAGAAEAEKKGVLVWLVVKEDLPHFCPSFACRVRVTQQNGQGQKWNKIVPCDVWRMEFAGFAWKLDVNTALSLGF